ncbi:sugar epimerase [Flavobacterium amnicola]|uniref:Sugar epimerase n=1 Tax=Flavobacterium amnicola TaxID=2506422 RepID=A0A4Q1K1Y4_9FLAO|nr:WxcM-like domain-containing protein [Flavobacterium amnicola]RXR17779.1 sugar epimerase [Flavobacterium amnicola]
MNPILLKGNCHSDDRGNLKYNNDFDASEVKRTYIIENKSTVFKRGWQGHKVEQRWFSALSGSFQIQLIKVDDWEHPSGTLEPFVFQLESETLDVLHIPAGYISCIQAMEENSKLLVMADYLLGQISDEFRYTLDQFNCTK